MKTGLMWTINDFPTYQMVYGWSTHEKLACPYYMENSKVFTLTNDGKISFFFTANDDYCQQITSTKRNKKDFVERDVAQPLLLSDELYDVMSEYSDIVFSFQSSK
jgi:hypothetical protein